MQTLALDRNRFPSRLAIRPRDLARLLDDNFQSTLQELTVIATDPGSGLSCVDDDIGGKAVQLLSYIDPTKGALLLMWLGWWCNFPRVIGGSYSADDWFVICELSCDLWVADDYDTRLHTQLWVDPSEFLEYVHAGEPVDVTFGRKELKVKV